MTAQKEYGLYRCWMYEVWGNEKDGYDVNDRYEIASDYVIAHSVRENAKEMKKVIRKIFGIKPQVHITLDGDWNYIFVERERDGYPICEMELVKEY